MRRRLVTVAIAVLSLGILGVGAADAAVPSACVVRTLGPLHIQVGYCP